MSHCQTCYMKGSVSQNITGTWGKNVSKKTTRSREGRNFFLTLSWRRPLSYRNQSIDLLRKKVLVNKKVLVKICNISHLLSCKLPRKFISWVSRKTKILDCSFCSTNHRGDSHGSTSTTSNISFQLRQTWSFCKYGLVLFLSLVYLVYCSVSVVIF